MELYCFHCHEIHEQLTCGKTCICVRSDTARELLPEELEEAEQVNRIMKTGLTEKQAHRIVQIQFKMRQLDLEAREIIKPTEEELRDSVECWLDNKHSELAEIISETWGSWEEVLEDRIMFKEETDGETV